MTRFKCSTNHIIVWVSFVCLLLTGTCSSQGNFNNYRKETIDKLTQGKMSYFNPSIKKCFDNIWINEFFESGRDLTSIITKNARSEQLRILSFYKNDRRYESIINENIHIEKLDSFIRKCNNKVTNDTVQLVIKNLVRQYRRDYSAYNVLLAGQFLEKRSSPFLMSCLDFPQYYQNLVHIALNRVEEKRFTEVYKKYMLYILEFDNYHNAPTGWISNLNVLAYISSEKSIKEIINGLEQPGFFVSNYSHDHDVLPNSHEHKFIDPELARYASVPLSYLRVIIRNKEFHTIFEDIDIEFEDILNYSRETYLMYPPLKNYTDEHISKGKKWLNENISKLIIDKSAYFDLNKIAYLGK